jgi:hypothetical protein
MTFSPALGRAGARRPGDQPRRPRCASRFARAILRDQPEYPHAAPLRLSAARSTARAMNGASGPSSGPGASGFVGVDREGNLPVYLTIVAPETLGSIAAVRDSLARQGARVWGWRMTAKEGGCEPRT